MKKLIIWVLTALVLATLAACGSGEAPLVEATPTIAQPTATPDPAMFTFDFSVETGLSNPSLPTSTYDSFDFLYSYAPYVVHYDGVFHMFYAAAGGLSAFAFDVSIGYATSRDGITFTRYQDSPVLAYSSDDEDKWQPQAPVVTVTEDGTWVMVVNDVSRSRRVRGPRLLRATAPAPQGPWTMDAEPLYEPDSEAWDGALVPQSITPGNNGRYLLMYDGRPLENGLLAIGALFSEDGMTFTPNGDPVLTPDPALEWEAGGVASPIVLATENGYEMFYTAFTRLGQFGGGLHSLDNKVRIGYATSADGVTWQRHPDNPVITLPDEDAFLYMSAVKVDGTYYIYYAIHAGAAGVGVVTGTITAH